MNFFSWNIFNDFIYLNAGNKFFLWIFVDILMTGKCKQHMIMVSAI